MSGRVQIPNSVPVGVPIGPSGSVPGAIPTPEPQAGPSFGVYSQIHQSSGTRSPYINMQPSINRAGSGVVNPPAPRQSVNPTVGGPRPVSPLSNRPTYGLTRPSTTTNNLGQFARPSINTPVGQKTAPPKVFSYGMTRPEVRTFPGVNGSSLRKTPVSRPISYGMTREGWEAAQRAQAARMARSPGVTVPASLPSLGGRSLSRTASPALRALGAGYRAVAPAIPYIAAGLDFAMGVGSGESVGQAGAGALGGLAGGLAGAQAGAALGTLLLPGVGTIAGGIIGGAIGGYGGGWLADRLYDTLFPNDALPDLNQPIERGPAPPFYGGQAAGIKYNVNLHFEYDNLVQGGVVDKPNGGGTFYGPIGYPEIGSYIDSFNRDTWYIGFSHGIQNSTAIGFFTPWVGVKTNASKPRLISFSVARTDGQPDVGGNLSPIPGTPDQPSLAPITAPYPTVFPATGTPTQLPTLSPSSPPDPFTPQSPVVPSNPLAPSAPPTPTTTPTLAPPADAQRGNTPIWNPIAALPFGIPAIIPATLGGRGSYPTLWRPPSITSSITTGGGAGATSPNPVCRFIADPHTPAINGRTQQMEIVQLAIQAYQTQMLTQVDTKLGPQVEGGVTGYLKKFWKWFHVDRIMNLLTFWVTVHNAIMLSNNIGQTLFGAFDIVFEIFGNQLKDDDGADISTSEWVGDQINDALKSVFGDQNVETVKGVWTKANRIYQATANIANAVQSMMYSITEGLEAVGKYVALIGNAAKRFGVVAEGAYGWMNVNPNFRTNKFFKILDGLQEGAEALEVVAGETQNIIQMKDEILTQKDELKNLIKEEEDGKKEEEDDSKKESVYPAAAAIKESNLIKPEE